MILKMAFALLKNSLRGRLSRRSGYRRHTQERDLHLANLTLCNSVDFPKRLRSSQKIRKACHRHVARCCGVPYGITFGVSPRPSTWLFSPVTVGIAAIFITASVVEYTRRAGDYRISALMSFRLGEGFREILERRIGLLDEVVERNRGGMI